MSSGCTRFQSPRGRSRGSAPPSSEIVPANVSYNMARLRLARRFWNRTRETNNLCFLLRRLRIQRLKHYIYMVDEKRLYDTPEQTKWVPYFTTWLVYDESNQDVKNTKTMRGSFMESNQYSQQITKYSHLKPYACHLSWSANSATYIRNQDEQKAFLMIEDQSTRPFP